jgi:hypothetical protein
MRFTKTCGISAVRPKLSIFRLGDAITNDATTAGTTVEIITVYATAITIVARRVTAVCPRGNHSFVPRLLGTGTTATTGYEQYGSRFG